MPGERLRFSRSISTTTIPPPSFTGTLCPSPLFPEVLLRDLRRTTSSSSAVVPAVMLPPSRPLSLASKLPVSRSEELSVVLVSTSVVFLPRYYLSLLDLGFTVIFRRSNYIYILFNGIINLLLDPRNSDCRMKII